MGVELFGKGVAKLEEANLSRTALKNHQLHNLASEVAATRRLRCLDLSYNDLSGMKPTILADLVASLHSALLDETQLCEAQVE